jgi:hypothetical protein
MKVAPSMKLSEIDWYFIYKKWSLNSGDFQYLFKSSPFVSAKYMEDFQLECPGENIFLDSIISMIKSNISKDGLIIVDTDSNLGIEIALMLNNQFNVAPILSYNFLFHPYGIVGNKNLIEDLVQAAENLKSITPITYAFILDSNRYTNDINLDNPYIFNNQYEITEEEMPDIQALTRLKKKSVTFFYSRGIKEDIACYLEHLRTNNITVKTILIPKHFETRSEF